MNALRAYEPDELGPDGYPPEWHATIKYLIREQAGHRCVRCLHPYRNGEHGNGEWTRCDEACQHGPPIRYRWDARLPWNVETVVAEGWRNALKGAEVESRWRILTVHHLDGDKTNCRWWNLVALCQRCHLRIQGRVVMARVWPWEHTDWFKPYVAGFYAWSYLGEDLARGEVEARLDDLLALERAA